LLTDPDALELAVRAQSLVRVVERRRSGEQLLELLVAIEPGASSEECIEEAAARIGIVGVPGPDIGMGLVLD
jgi:antitoxin component of MazEF toxin-antitoxin module